MSNDLQLIRQRFGEEIRKYRHEQPTIISQERLSIRINMKLNNGNLSRLNQKSISRIELADSSVILPSKTVKAIAEECNIPSDVFQPYLDLMNVVEDIKGHKKPLVSIKEKEQLLANPSNTEFENYQGEYYCYFYSTDSAEPKLIKGRLFLNIDTEYSMCRAELKVLRDDEPIKVYCGQFVLNLHYRKAYMVLIGKDKQELCFLIFNHFNSTINLNQLNMALALTSSSGSQKRPTMHRVLISRKQLNEKSEKLIIPELKLNTDKIIISESNLEKLQKEISKKFELEKENNNHYVGVLNCIKYIKENCTKEAYYTIDESIIYDSSTITEDEIERSYIISILREKSNTEFYNKISDTIEEICLKIVNNQE